jgi:hypothetical protein
MVSQKASSVSGSSPSSPSDKSTGSLEKEDLPERKFKNFRTLLSMKVAAEK